MSQKPTIYGIVFALIVFSAALLYFDNDVDKWQTYSNVQYGFSIRHPQSFKVLTTNGSSNLDIGLPDYIEELNNVNSSDGGDGIPLYLRIVSNVSTKYGLEEEFICEGKSTTIFVGGAQATKCEYMALGSFPSINILFKSDGNSYSIQSNRYTGDDQAAIDKIISTFRFS